MAHTVGINTLILISIFCLRQHTVDGVPWVPSIRLPSVKFVRTFCRNLWPTSCGGRWFVHVKNASVSKCINVLLVAIYSTTRLCTYRLSLSLSLSESVTLQAAVAVAVIPLRRPKLAAREFFRVIDVHKTLLVIIGFVQYLTDGLAQCSTLFISFVSESRSVNARLIYRFADIL